MTDCTMTSMTPSLPVKFAGKQILCDISIIHLLLHMYWIHLYTWDIHMPCIHVYTWDDVSCIIPCSTSGAMSRLAHRLPSGSWAPHITPICSSNLILSLILDPWSLFLVLHIKSRSSLGNFKDSYNNHLQLKTNPVLDPWSKKNH